MKLSINLVTLNGRKYLPACLKSVFGQSFRDFSVLIIDNASTDDTKEYLRVNHPQVKVVGHKKNRGFSRAHNEGILWTDSDYVLILNQDIILEPNFLAEAVKFLDENRGVGGVTGKLLRLSTDFSRTHESRVIDSTGLKIFKNYRVVDRGAGEENRGQYNETEEIFGLSGACSIFRREALEDTKLSIEWPVLKKGEGQGSNTEYGEYFDQDFFAYKEDLDLSWRLRLYGWKLFYLPQAQAYHLRTAVGDADLPEIPTVKTIKTRLKKSQIVNYLSYKNHLLTIIKNEFLINLILYFPFIFIYELKKLIWILFFEQKTLKSLFRFFQQLPRALRKRRIIMIRKRVKAKEIRRWM